METIRRTLADIKPLPQPNPKALDKVVRRGLAQGVVDHGISSIENKQQKNIERYIREMGTFAATVITLGGNPELVGEDTKTAINMFLISGSALQRQLHHDVISSIDVQLSKLFESNLTLHKELSLEAGTAPDLLQRKMELWNRKFKNATRRERVDIGARLKEINGEILLGQFPVYAQEWERILRERMGFSSEEAEAQRIKLEESFSNASGLGKIGISKTLREKMLEASSVSFHHGIDTLKRLRAVEGITVDSERFPDPSSLKALYQSSTLEGRNYVISLIAEACNRLIANVKKPKRP